MNIRTLMLSMLAALGTTLNIQQPKERKMVYPLGESPRTKGKRHAGKRIRSNRRKAKEGAKRRRLAA